MFVWEKRMAEEETEKIEETIEKKKQEIPWWKRLSPTVLVIGGVVIYFIFRSMMMDAENKGTYIFGLIGLGIFLYMMSQTSKTKEEEVVNPAEAEWLVKESFERKKKWGQFPKMSTCKVGPVINLKHKDGRGVHYPIAFELNDPYSKPKYYCAQVTAKGVERGFVLFIETIGPFNGREVEHEKSYIPGWVLKSHKYPVLRDLFMREREK